MFKWLLCSYILFYLRTVISFTATNLFTSNNVCYYTSTDKYMKYQLNSSYKLFNGTIFEQEVCLLREDEHGDVWHSCRPFNSSYSVPCTFVQTKDGDYITKNLYCILAPSGDKAKCKVRSVAYMKPSFNIAISNLTNNTSNFLKLYSDEESANVAHFCNCDWSTLLPTIEITPFGRNITIIMKYTLNYDFLIVLKPTVSLITETNDTILKEEIPSQVKSILENKKMSYNVPNLSPCKTYFVNVNVSSSFCQPSYGVLNKRVPVLDYNALYDKPELLACNLNDSKLTATWSSLPVYYNSEYYYKYGMSDNNGKLLRKGEFSHHGPFQVETNERIVNYNLQICKSCLCGPVMYAQCKYNGDKTTLPIIKIAIVSSLVVACIVACFVMLLIKRKYFAPNDDLKEENVVVVGIGLDLDNQTLQSVIPNHYEEPCKLYDHLNHVTTKL